MLGALSVVCTERGVGFLSIDVGGVCEGGDCCVVGAGGAALASASARRALAVDESVRRRRDVEGVVLTAVLVSWGASVGAL